jgi:hypothetical protein
MKRAYNRYCKKYDFKIYMKITLTQQERLELFREVLNKKHQKGSNYIAYQTFEKHLLD